MELNGPCCGTVEIAYLIADGIYIKHGTMLPNDAKVIFLGRLIGRFNVHSDFKRNRI